MVTADQLLCHAIGDYVIQSHWMATEKTKRWSVALIHAASYALPFLLLRPSLAALAVMVFTHALIDRYRLAKYVSAVKNRVLGRNTIAECLGNGAPPDAPPFLAVWLLIIVDNVMHILINAAALRWL